MNTSNGQKHTQGPWHVERHSGAFEIWPEDKGQNHAFIGRVMRQDDARLIAASPELLEALRALLDAIPSADYNDTEVAILNQCAQAANAAIRKATTTKGE